jgi:glyoxylate utilization-related uncharacterized protein
VGKQVFVSFIETKAYILSAGGMIMLNLEISWLVVEIGDILWWAGSA